MHAFPSEPGTLPPLLSSPGHILIPMTCPSSSAIVSHTSATLALSGMSKTTSLTGLRLTLESCVGASALPSSSRATGVPALFLHRPRPRLTCHSDLGAVFPASLSTSSAASGLSSAVRLLTFTCIRSSRMPPAALVALVTTHTDSPGLLATGHHLNAPAVSSVFRLAIINARVSPILHLSSRLPGGPFAMTIVPCSIASAFQNPFTSTSSIPSSMASGHSPR